MPTVVLLYKQLSMRHRSHPYYKSRLEIHYTRSQNLAHTEQTTCSSVHTDSKFPRKYPMSYRHPRLRDHTHTLLPPLHLLHVLRVGLVLGNLVVQSHVERVDLCRLELAGRHLALEQDVELGMSAYVS